MVVKIFEEGDLLEGEEFCDFKGTEEETEAGAEVEQEQPTEGEELPEEEMSEAETTTCQCDSGYVR